MNPRKLSPRTIARRAKERREQDMELLRLSVERAQTTFCDRLSVAFSEMVEANAKLREHLAVETSHVRRLLGEKQILEQRLADLEASQGWPDPEPPIPENLELVDDRNPLQDLERRS